MATTQRCAYRVERMGQRAGDPVGVQVLRTVLDIAAVQLEPLVVGARDVEAEDVDCLRLAAEASGQLLGNEYVGATGDLDHSVNRVVIGDRYEVHAAPLRELVDLLGRCCALRQAERALYAQARYRGCAGVTVQVDAGCGPLFHGAYCLGHMTMIRLQTRAFCDQTVNSPRCYQDLHDLPLCDC